MNPTEMHRELTEGSQGLLNEETLRSTLNRKFFIYVRENHFSLPFGRLHV
jgi:hypothetical protein